MISYTFKRDHRFNRKITDVSNFYQKSFALALLNWEINRQEERLKALTTISIKTTN
jgi:hypothetical protein